MFKNPNWDWRTFLRAFMRRGGKLLLYHGWADANFSAQSTIDYYRKSQSTTELEVSTRPRISGVCGRNAFMLL